MDMLSLKSIDLGFALVEFGKGYAICRMREGADLAADHMDNLFKAIEQQIDGTYSIILDDLYPYSMRFEALIALKKNPRLNRIGVVAYRLVTHGVAKMSMHIVGKHYRVFDNLHEAVDWIDT